MEEKRNHRRYPSLVWPIVLITAGVMFLLSNLGVLEVDFWQLWRVWPVLLILGGLDIILGRRSFVGNLVVVTLTVAIMTGMVILLAAAPDYLAPSTSGGVESIDEPLDGIERADLDIDFIAGKLEIGRQRDSSSLITGQLELSTRHEPIWKINRKSGQAIMSLGYERTTWAQTWHDEWSLDLSPRALYALELDIGAGEATIDLTGLHIQGLNVSTGAGQSTLICPVEGDFSAAITGGVGRLVVKIPEGMAARVQVNHGIGGVNIPSRFEDRGHGQYQTHDWDTNENRVDLEIEIGVGEVVLQGF